MNTGKLTDTDGVYKLQDDVYLSYNEVSECSRILKFNDDDYFYEANLVACEIVRKINGKETFRQIVENVAAAYEPAHLEDIWNGANNLLSKLLDEKLIYKVK